MATTTTTNTAGWLQPYQSGYLNAAGTAATNPYLQSPTQVAQPNQTQQAGYEALANRASSGSPLMGAATNQLQQTINGGYLNSNPYLESMINASQGDVVRNYNNVAKPQMEASMVRSGSFGNSGLQQMQLDQQNQLQQNLGRISGDMRYNNYANERTNQMNAINRASEFANNDYLDIQNLVRAGDFMQAPVNAQNAQNLQWWQEARDDPARRLNLLGSALGNVQNNNYTQSSSTPGTSTAASVLGGALTGAQIWNLLK
jgi:hypothetical protein